MIGRSSIALLAIVLGFGGVIGVDGALAAVDVGATLDRATARVGEQVVLTVRVEGEARDVSPPRLPVLSSFRLHAGGQSQRFSFVNGRVSAEHSFTFYLQPLREGQFTIDPIQVSVDGHDYKTASLELKILASSAPVPVPAPSRPSSPGTRTNPNADDAFVTMSVDRDSVVVGEQIVLTFAFYRATRMSAFQTPEYTPPRSEGFWREDLPPERHTTRVIRSRRYQVTEIQYALFPTRVGTLTIGEATVRLPEDVFGGLLRRSRDRRASGPKLLRAPSIAIEVAPLPQPVPPNFSGTVASDLDLDAAVDRREFDEGEAITLSLRLEGDGHLPSVAVPDFGELEDFRVHDAGGAAESRPRAGRLHGIRSIDKLVIAQRPGRLQIPGLDYVYFDTRRRDYVTLRIEPIDLLVHAVEGGAQGVFVGGRKSEIELLARDIQHIVAVPAAVHRWPGPLPQRGVFYAALAVPGLLWVVSATAARRRDRILADPRRVRASRALKVAQAGLASADPIEERVVKSVHGWAADRFDRSATGLTHDEVIELATRNGATEDHAVRLRVLLDRCDAARYAPLGSGGDELVREAGSLLRSLEEVTRAN